MTQVSWPIKPAVAGSPAMGNRLWRSVSQSLLVSNPGKGRKQRMGPSVIEAHFGLCLRSIWESGEVILLKAAESTATIARKVTIRY